MVGIRSRTSASPFRRVIGDSRCQGRLRSRAQGRARRVIAWEGALLNGSCALGVAYPTSRAQRGRETNSKAAGLGLGEGAERPRAARPGGAKPRTARAVSTPTDGISIRFALPRPQAAPAYFRERSEPTARAGHPAGSPPPLGAGREGVCDGVSPLAAGAGVDGRRLLRSGTLPLRCAWADETNRSRIHNGGWSLARW